MGQYLRLFSFLVAFSLAFSLKPVDVSHTPRMTITDKDVSFKRVAFHGNHTHMELLQGPEDSIYAAGRQLLTVDFQSQSVKNLTVFRGDHCSSPDCQYNITVLHKDEGKNELLICGTNRKEGLCCHMDLSHHPAACPPSEKLKPPYQEWEPSLLIGSDLYTTKSGKPTTGSVGIHRFGNVNTSPKGSLTELKYLGLAVSGPREERLQDKLYAFYTEKNPEPDGELWGPRVSQICLADVGGTKRYLQFKWTSHLRAKLACGDPVSRQYFSQLVDVVTLKAERWQDTRVYTLFTHVWGLSAVCVYTMEDIDRVFTGSTLRGYTGSTQNPRPGECVTHSDKLPPEFLTVVNEYSEMVERVEAKPLLVSHHGYTHIRADRVQGVAEESRQHTVLFLSTENGRVHKVLEEAEKTFVIAEYQPFAQRARILNMLVQSHTRKLYVSSSSELVQVDLGSCAQYGDQCEDCILARDPYCGWNGTACISATNNTRQDVNNGNITVCAPKQRASKKGSAAGNISVPLNSNHFLRCPTLSGHAAYSWQHNGSSTPCFPVGRRCLLLIDSMAPGQTGVYKCQSEERGYLKTLALYRLYTPEPCSAVVGPVVHAKGTPRESSSRNHLVAGVIGGVSLVIMAVIAGVIIFKKGSARISSNKMESRVKCEMMQTTPVSDSPLQADASGPLLTSVTSAPP